MLRFFYFPKMPLEVVKLSGFSMDDPRLKDRAWHQAKFNDFAQVYNGRDVIKSMEEEGQLNPGIGYWNPSGEEWVVEPGQTRWQASYVLGWPTMRLLVKATEEEMEHFHLLEHIEHTEITSREEVEKLFGETVYHTEGKKKGKINQAATTQRKAEFIVENWEAIYDALPGGAMTKTGTPKFSFLV